MNNNRLINLGVGAGILLVLLLGWFFGVSPILDQMAAVNAQTLGFQQNNAASGQRLATLKKQFENIAPLEKKLEKLQESIPTDADIAAFLAEINALCAANGVSLTSLTVNDALEYVAPGAVVPPPADPGATPDPSATSDPTAPVTPSPSSGLIAIPVRVSVAGPYGQVMAFTGALQTGKRLLLITSLTVGLNNSTYTGTVAGNIYALPLPPGVVLPTPTPSPTPTPTPTPTVTITPGPTDLPTPDPTQSADG